VARGCARRGGDSTRRCSPFGSWYYVAAGRSAIVTTSRHKGNKSGGEGGSHQLKLLEDITVLVGRTEDYQEALEGVVRLVAVAMDCEVCSLYSYDTQSETLSLAATHGLPTRSIGRVSMHKTEGLVGLTAEQGSPVTVEDAIAHKRFKFFPELGEEKYHAFLGVPVGEGDTLLGVLVLQSRRRRRFLPDEISLLRAVAGHVRAILVNAHLSERLQREEEEREVYRRNMVRAIQRLEAYEAARRKGKTPGPTELTLTRLSGQGASPGFGIGHAFVIVPAADLALIDIRQAEDVTVELQRFEDALTTSSTDVEHARQRMRELVPEVGGALYEALRMIMEDQSFSTRVRDEITSGSRPNRRSSSSSTSMSRVSKRSTTAISASASSTCAMRANAFCAT
jgi:phosphotransferase system enzyme I (PtsP)